MEITLLKEPKELLENKKLQRRYAYFQELFTELKKQDLPDRMLSHINQEVEALNHFEGSGKELSKKMQKTIHQLLRQLEKDLKIVPKNLYRNRWMAIGMTALGVPFGVAFGAALDNMAFMGIGFPLGLVMGMAIGAGMDQKAEKEGRQLQIEAVY